jgi:hypothetical protein
MPIDTAQKRMMVPSVYRWFRPAGVRPTGVIDGLFRSAVAHSYGLPGERFPGMTITVPVILELVAGDVLRIQAEKFGLGGSQIVPDATGIMIHAVG